MTTEVNRKDLMLLLLFSPGKSGEEAEPIDGRTRLMKLLFLLQKQNDFPIEKVVKQSLLYNFQPYNYGPFTKDVYDDIEFLENVGLVKSQVKGEASPADQNEEEKVVEDIMFGIDEEGSNLLFEEESFKLTDRGKQFVREKVLPIVPLSLISKVRELKTKFAKAPLTSLLRYVYSSYPEYAQKSKLTYLIPSD